MTAERGATARLSTILAFGSLALAACGDSPGSDPAAPEDPPPPPVRIVDGDVDITLRSGTVRVSADMAAAALVSMDTTAQSYTFDATALSAAGIEMEIGRTLFVDGLALRKIATVQEAGGSVTVGTTDAILTDAIESGTIAWDEPLDFTSETLQSAQLVRPDGQTVPRVVSESGAIQFSYTVGEYTYKLQILPLQGPAQVVVEVTKKTPQRVTARFTFKGTISQGRTGGQIVVQGGQTQQFDYRNTGMQGTLDLDFAITGDSAPDFSFEYPEPFIRFPITVGPIPILVTLKLQVATRISVPLGFQASATLKSRFQYSGDVGFQFVGGSFANSSTMPTPTLGPSVADAAALIGGPVDAQIRLGIPRAEFAMFGNTIVPFLRIELFAGTQLHWGPICKTATVQFLVTAGADLRFLGTTLASLPGDTLVGPHTLTPPGNACPQSAFTTALPEIDFSP